MIENNYDTRKQKFYEMYQNKIAPIMFQFEPKRKRLKFLVISFSIISAFIILGCIAGIMMGLLDMLPVEIICIIMFASILYPIFLCFQSSIFKQDLKKNCLSYITKIFGNLRWKLEFDAVSDSDIKNSSLFKVYTDRICDDGFIGNYKGVDFQVSETYLYKEVQRGDKRCVDNIFNGVIINCKFNKPIQSKTIVKTKYDNLEYIITNIILLPLLLCYVASLCNYSFGLFEKFITIGVCVIVLIDIVLTVFYKNKSEKFELVKLEDPSFGNRFNVYSSDQVEARYLVTPSFMDRFYNLKTACGSKGIKCSFYDGKLMIAIPTNKDLFEIGSVFIPLTNPKCINKFYKELSSIYDLIDTLKLDEKTGL